MTTSSDVINPAGAASGSSEPSSWATRFLIAAAVFIGISLVLLSLGQGEDPGRPFLGYLLGFGFWLSILIGMLFLLMISWLFGAGWSIIIRRQIEHAIGAFPLMAVIFLPLLVFSLAGTQGPEAGWIWMHPDAMVPGGHGTVSHDVLYIHKSGFLDKTFFIVRYVMYFAVWGGLAFLFRSWSLAMDETGDHTYVNRSRKLAAAGLFLCAFATTFAAIDWFKSLSYHWFSTMYGVWFFAASFRAALSATVLLLFYQGSRSNQLKGIVKRPHYYLMGCLMLAFTVFWAYISFCQYFLIYNANIPEETFWYNIRELALDGTKNSWWWVSLALIFFHFFFPFLWLLWYKNKFEWRLKFIAIWVLVFHLLDMYWNIVPQKIAAENKVGYVVRGFSINLIDVTMFLGVGALVIWVFLRNAAKHRPIPIRDPFINESLHCHE